MNRDRLLNTIGFSLIGLCFLLSAYRILNRSKALNDPNQITIRFTHWNLESGVREGLDAVAAEYMKLHPNVRIIQGPVPEQIYPNWVITQLVGKTAPDLILIGKGIDDEKLARYFIPITQYVDEPNPYNKGTDLEGVPWRDTYIDGMQGAYNAALLEYYGAPTSMHVIRLYYNRELLKKISGLDHVPDNYSDFLKLCETIQDYSKRTGDYILPIAGSKYNTPQLVDRLFASQTQSIISHPSSAYFLRPDWANLSTSYWSGGWSLEDPPIRSGLQLMHEVTRHMQPGFLALKREDATFYFVQQKAVMITSGSWDRNSIKVETNGIFNVGVCQLPTPTPGSEGIGKYVLGPTSEANVRTYGGFGIPRASKNFSTSLDFQRFLTSRRGNQIFVDNSGWLPAIRGVIIPDELKPFAPILEGYPGGFTLVNNTDTRRVIESNLHLLYGPQGGVDAFIASVKPKYAEAIANDIRISNRATLRSVQRSETPLGALRFLINRNNPHASIAKMEELEEIQNINEAVMQRNNFNLRAAGYSLKQ